MLSFRWYVISGIGFLLFLFLQVFPNSDQISSSGGNGVLERDAARQQALGYAAEKWGIRPDETSRIVVTHLSDSDTVGYLSKERLSKAYDKTWDAKFPTDVYEVELRPAGSDERLTLALHMQSGQLVSWDRVSGNRASLGLSKRQEEQLAATVPAGREQTAAALAWVGQAGYDEAEWEPTGDATPDGAVVLQSRKSELGEARLQLTVKPGERLTYRYVLPASYTDYMAGQEKIAGKLSIFGFVLPMITLFVLAVIYAATYSGWSSFRRGIFLSSAFFLLYAGFTFNLKAGIRAQMGAETGDGAVMTLLIVNLFIYAAMALLTYFSAVGGDGLWRSMGYSLWPRWRDPGFGASVLRSAGQGYVLAMILLGAQSIILVVLQALLGSFYSSDASQSMYNMAYPWLLPLLGWCAGISEELQSRLFSIGLFRRWFVGGARRILRRDPSRRSAATLTLIAMVPASAIWAFGHVGYAVYPVYTRLIELTLMGLLFGWFMLRFGLLAVLFAHVVLDSTLMGVQMLSDGLSSDNWGGVFSFIMPAAVGIIVWWLRRRFPGRGAAGAKLA
ncbi:CPBP family intramembrane glutamic endopeptidase [Cohnella nanjingensis]|uniref:CPBP family intramembrane metalloprotease n=1 Tax=Cohnella nanjingensis TaxID=1387779 RepID=A0A7X0VFT7_9BACL|nr:CPBP family intramembrane glutamic endopeptidase [Cohnella nanjingensis]MBB6670959.1 CPBP family intramembrane metalloprotease [Cohnella nanjingensis]